MDGKGADPQAAAEAATLASSPAAARRQSERSVAPLESGAPPGASGPRARPITAAANASERAIARALRDDERTRAHAFSGLTALLAFGSLCSLPIVGGDAFAKLLGTAVIALVFSSSLAMFRVTRKGRRPSRRAMRAYGFTIGACAVGLQYYVGFFSAGATVMTVTIYFFGLSSDRVLARYVPALVCGAFLIAGALVVAGTIPDVGLINAGNAPAETRLMGMVQTSIVLVLTASLAMLSQRSVRAAMAQSNEALLVARRGEALLAEAQQHLERALGVVIGQPSHYSGQLAGPYQLGIVIGVGAMAEVYAAEHVETGEPAAVKLMRPADLSRADLVERFSREGAICSSLHNPHLVAIHGVGRLDDGAPYIAMELLRGQDLATRLRKEGKLAPAEALELAHALAEGLSAVHQAGIVHRDLKPMNVFRDEPLLGRASWKILDFGISKPRASSGTLTHVGVVGTPGYMSPEQARGLPIDQRSDVFAMGALLYRTLTGRPAFIGNDAPQIMFDVAYKMPEQPSLVVRELTSDIDAVLALALAKDPYERFGSARELADALTLAVRGELPELQRDRARTLLGRSPWGRPVAGAPGASDADQRSGGDGFNSSI